MNPILKHSYVQLNGSYIHLTQYSSNERSFLGFSSNSGPKKLVLFIPGNPGMLGIYHDFLISLHKTFNCSSTSRSDMDQDDTVILAISHNNFDHPDSVNYKTDERIEIETSDLNPVEKAIAEAYNYDPHHIELQVLNKLIVLRRLIDFTKTKIVCVGHSIGCYIIIRILKDRLVSSSHEGSILIHPALENLATTDKGSECLRIFNYKLDYVLIIVAYALEHLLPRQVKLMLVRWFCSDDFVEQSSEIVLDSVMQIVRYKSLRALIQMAKSELVMIKDLNTRALIKPHATKLRLIYAINDHWVHTDNRRVLQEEYPDLYIEEQSKMHAFVMDPVTVNDYAVKVGMYIRDFFDSIS